MVDAAWIHHNRAPADSRMVPDGFRKDVLAKADGYIVDPADDYIAQFESMLDGILPIPFWASHPYP